MSNLVPALLGAEGDSPRPVWLPDEVVGTRQVLLFVLDGLGWEQLQERRALAPTLCGLAGVPITTVAPSTTASALCSITTGLAPAAHGLVGYRMRVGPGEVLNVLRWTTPRGDARKVYEPTALQPVSAFGGTKPPVISKAEFGGTGFTQAHLAGTRLDGWRVPSSIAVEVRRLLLGGERFVYAYYDGLDKVAHERGFGEHFDAELQAIDRLVADVLAVLPHGAALVITADHGQVQVDQDPITLDAAILQHVVLLSGEGRFRWLHVRTGAAEDVAAAARDLYGNVAWVHTCAEVIERNWLGGVPDHDVAGRLGDVALAAHAPVAFDDPADTGEMRLVCRHGSLTAAEMLVPLLTHRV